MKGDTIVIATSDRGRPRDRAGFTLVEIIVAVAIIAILAGTITPMVFRELMQAREEATVRELDTLSAGLLSFYEDTGRMPTEGEGLGALVIDPGVSGWQGPYVGSDRGDPVNETTTDGFGQTYAYDLAPSTNPAGVADVVIASAGIDGSMTSGTVGGTWTVAGTGDDLLLAVTTGPVNRDKLRDCEEELEAIGDAARGYYEDHAAFPTTITQLSPEYMDAGIAGSAFIDPWNLSYGLILVTGGTVADALTLRSRGPDRQDDGGGDDDLSLTVSSLSPGRRTSYWRLEIAQVAINNNPSTVLTGSWPTDRAVLGLAPVFDADGWGRLFNVNVSSRAVFSVGPDGNASLVADNLPAGVGP